MSAIAVILILIIILSVGLNGILIISLFNRWSRLKCQDVVLLLLSICDFCQTIVGYPLEITLDSQMEKTKCITIGYSVSSLALVSIAILTSLSIGRMLSVTHPLKYYLWMKNKLNSLFFIIPSFIYGFFCASLPLIGWSKYTPELQSKYRCSINLNDQNVGTITYLYFLLVFCYVVPIAIMVCCFIRIRKQLQRSSSVVKPSGSMSESTRGSSDRSFSILLFFMLIAFLLAWTPYALVLFLLSVSKKITLAWADCAAMLGKSSVLFNPVIYALLYKKFRTSVAELFGKCSVKIGPTKSSGPCKQTDNDNNIELKDMTTLSEN